MNALLDSLFNNLLSEFVMVILGIVFTYGIWRGYLKLRYGKWHVVIMEGDEVKLDRKISARKAKEILEEPADLSVFLKGVVSPYAWIGCDLVEDGKKIGLFEIDKVDSRFVIDLAKNPQRPDPTNADVVAAINRLTSTLASYNAQSGK